MSQLKIIRTYVALPLLARIVCIYATRLPVL